MGCYVNPPCGQKEVFLTKEGNGVTDPAWPAPEGEMYVCLVDNGPFAAAGIAFCESEFNMFMRDDGRIKFWFSVPVEKLKSVSNLLDYVRTSV